jgi:iron complex transport system ATP-binding protein
MMDRAIEGIAVAVDAEAVVVVAERPVSVVSSAPVGGGVARVRSLLNVHVAKDFAGGDLAAPIAALARARRLPAPWVGFLTAARTERAEIATDAVDDAVALAVVTVGLTLPITAGVTPAADDAVVGTVNTIVVVDADLETAALVNAVSTVAEVKAAVLGTAGVQGADGALATGTATDAIAVAATGAGPRFRFGGPVTVPGAAVARAARRALERGVARWLESRR